MIKRQSSSPIMKQKQITDYRQSTSNNQKKKLNLISKEILIKNRFIKDLQAPTQDSFYINPSSNTHNNIRSYMLGLISSPISNQNNDILKSFHIKQLSPLNALEEESHLTKMIKKKRDLLKMVTPNNTMLKDIFPITTMTSDPNNLLLKNTLYKNDHMHYRMNNKNQNAKKLFSPKNNGDYTDNSHRYTRNTSMITQSISQTKRSKSPVGSLDSVPTFTFCNLNTSRSSKMIKHNRYLSVISSVNTFKPFD